MATEAPAIRVITPEGDPERQPLLQRADSLPVYHETEENGAIGPASPLDQLDSSTRKKRSKKTLFLYLFLGLLGLAALAVFIKAIIDADDKKVSATWAVSRCPSELWIVRLRQGLQKRSWWWS